MSRKASMSSEQDCKKVRILFVEDDVDLRNFLVDEFEDLGLEVQSAENGLRALEELKKNEFDAILSDVRMPDMDGLALFSEVQKTEYKKLPFIFYTGYAEALNLEEAYQIGAKGYFQKPTSLTEIVEFIHKCIQETKALNEIISA